ncbi:hypothetical protein GOV12_05320 [Candidatus Pacearchaeota archaeon]|nr:hypothetical protein [Candidatus Pacearchaeota archaeon]
MGFVLCRFRQDEGCPETGSQEWHIYLPNVNKRINVPSMWKHYMLDHLVQPTDEERTVIMEADPSNASGMFISTRGAETPEELMVLYVQRTGVGQYTHEVGTEPDVEFIKKLESILEKVQPCGTKGLGNRPGYR